MLELLSPNWVFSCSVFVLQTARNAALFSLLCCWGDLVFLIACFGKVLLGLGVVSTMFVL